MESHFKAVEYTLLGKIEAAQRECSAPIVIVADTLVEDRRPVERWANRPIDEALNMLLRLSGRHRVGGTAVLGGVWYNPGSSATVSIDSLSDDALEALIVSNLESQPELRFGGCHGSICGNYRR